MDDNQTAPTVPAIEAPSEEVLTAAPVMAEKPVEKKEAPAPKVKGITFSGKKKKAPIKRGRQESATELREQLTSLLSCLTQVRETDRRRWVDLVNANKPMAKVEAQMKRTRFYVWKTYGEAVYLLTGHLVKPTAVAMILPEGRSFRWTIENSRGTTGVESSLQKAKDTVMLYRESFPA